ncbi:diaminopimelate decarboxylase [Clostridium butyricum]|uniref:Diaminopimelate decarboxylase n=1 Tax=Clostridium butyricum TaxID=1492 RepID=A0A512TN73_CLOBU|nr:diaminopimelate decarboxylase [Clostridium butyricum]NAS18229.1 diaminopimelate decarboxylase [Clostridium butyricum]NOW24100.1 diaminopimelate decarboxylase [Clostridium butyricum]GEQ21712.1 diaminopimelate decarboxylase [Clostridium butyricum]
MKLFGTMKVEDNQLTIGGAKASDLVKEYGSPLYVFDEELIREYCRDYRNYFRCEENNNRVAFAGKAFLTVQMCKLLKEENMSLDVVSGGELYTAYKAGFPLERVMFHGNNKTLDEIELGVKLGVGNFVVDNHYEMEVLNDIAKSYGKTQNIYLRITPGIEAHTHDYIKTGQIDSKFGFAPVGTVIEDAVEKAINLENINLAGIHCHIGSQIFELQPYEDAVEVMLALVKKIQENYGYFIKEVDFGGGFGIYYNKGDKPRTTREYCETIINKVDEVCRRTGQERPILTIEPGRSIVANAGSTLYTVGSVKEIPGVRTYVAVDGGMTDNIRPALYNAAYECVIANRVNSECGQTVTIAGKCCESGDILLENVELPEVTSGDILAILTTGAYGYSMSSNYNRIPKPAVVMIRDEQARLVCKRESYEDIIRNDVL